MDSGIVVVLRGEAVKAVAEGQGSAMDVGELYYLARRLKLLAENGLGARADQVDEVPVHQQLVLGEVLAVPGSSIKDIGERSSLAQSIVSKAVASLREQELLVTQSDPSDRRRVRVFPSPRVASWARSRSRSDVAPLLAPYLVDLPDDDRACVHRALVLLHEGFQRHQQLVAHQS